MEANSSHAPTALMSTGRDDSAITCKGFCMISWNLKADVPDGYVIFVTGDPVTLGCWEPDMAVQLAPSVKSSNEWTAEIKVPYGVHYRYNYFVREEKGSSNDIIWRPGPECSLSIPSVSRKKTCHCCEGSLDENQCDRYSLSFLGIMADGSRFS